ncbi:cysteine-rich CWC family protein [Olivibacter sitiensis]|uniref:cysteine-rich CWC family protein n=1 Tax=Olivibacter sitiensis TaxID=376470 RepID=UPI001FDF83FC|nr:cysteine-rich CWC family protein [Olivibacter sitiensis]
MLTKSIIRKHEIVHCGRCGQQIECKANAYAKCQCSTVHLSVDEIEYISECYDNCLCASCLRDMRQEFRFPNTLCKK